MKNILFKRRPPKLQHASQHCSVITFILSTITVIYCKESFQWNNCNGTDSCVCGNISLLSCCENICQQEKGHDLQPWLRISRESGILEVYLITSEYSWYINSCSTRNIVPEHLTCHISGFLENKVKLQCPPEKPYKYTDFNVSLFHFHIITEGEGYLQCQVKLPGYKYPILSNKFLKQDYDNNRYALTVNQTCENETCKVPTLTDLYKFSQAISKEFNIRVIPALIIDTQMIVHVINYSDKLIGYNYDNFSVVKQQSVQYCPAIDIWPQTIAGGIALSGNRKIRHCSSNFTVGAHWAQIVQLKNEESSITKELKKIYLSNKEKGSHSALADLQSILQLKTNWNLYSSTDVLYIDNIFKAISQQKFNASSVQLVASIVDSLINLAKHCDIFKKAQNIATSTYSFLDNLDVIMNNINLQNSEHGEAVAYTPNFITYLSDTNISVCTKKFRGIALLDNNAKPDEKDLIHLTWNNTDKSLPQDVKIKAAVFLPLQVVTSLIGLEQLEETSDEETLLRLQKFCIQFNETQNKKDFKRLVINFYTGNELFIPRNNFNRTVSTILSVSINGRKNSVLKAPITLMFDRKYENQGDLKESKCVFWDLEESKWSSAGCIRDKSGTCSCFHLTHFAELLSETDSTDKSVHHIISLFGCSISLIGLLGVGITASIFPLSRHGLGRKLLLHLCVSLAFLAITLISRNFITNTDLKYICCLSGGAMQFSLLSSLNWMLAVGFYQQRKVSKPFLSLNPPRHYLMIANIMSWGIPLLITTITILIAHEIYSPPKCYPNGWTLQLCIVFPAGLSVVIGCAIFAVAIQAICKPAVKGCSDDEGRQKRQLLCSLCLFSVLGTGWVFHLLGWDIMFNLSASLQGISVFTFVVILDNNNRKKWVSVLCPKRTTNKNFITLTSSR